MNNLGSGKYINVVNIGKEQIKLSFGGLVLFIVCLETQDTLIEN